MYEETHAAVGLEPCGAAAAGAAADLEFALEAFDHCEGYCRKLGHHVSFAYCRGRHESRGRSDSLPCGRIADCWFERLPIEAYLRSNYSEEELRAILAPAPPKLMSILEIIARAQAQAQAQAEPQT